MVLIPKLATIDAYIPHWTHKGVTSRFANPRAMASWREGTKLAARMHTSKIVHSSSFQLFWAERIASSSQSISLVNCFFLISVSRSFYCALLSNHDVASPVTLDKICPIILKFRGVTRVYILFRATCLSPTQRALVSLQSKLQKLLFSNAKEFAVSPAQWILWGQTSPSEWSVWPHFLPATEKPK